MSKGTKDVTMMVTVRVPDWLTSEEARKEVRSLIRDQCFFGHRDAFDSWEEIGSDNFKLVKCEKAPKQGALVATS